MQSCSSCYLTAKKRSQNCLWYIEATPTVNENTKASKVVSMEMYVVVTVYSMPAAMACCLASEVLNRQCA